MENKNYTLIRDCEATIVPAGETTLLKKGTCVFVSQALGGTLTLRTDTGLFRIEGHQVDALGQDAADLLQDSLKPPPQITNPSKPFNEETIWSTLKNCFDPEIPINIVDLGLIYDLSTHKLENGKQDVNIKMTLTAQGCGMGPAIAKDAKEKLEAVPNINSATVEIVWDPVWNPHMISEEGKKILGL